METRKKLKNYNRVCLFNNFEVQNQNERPEEWGKTQLERKYFIF